jgi:hypothetical protein
MVKDVRKDKNIYSFIFSTYTYRLAVDMLFQNPLPSPWIYIGQCAAAVFLTAKMRKYKLVSLGKKRAGGFNSSGT